MGLFDSYLGSNQPDHVTDFLGKHLNPFSSIFGGTDRRHPSNLTFVWMKVLLGVLMQVMVPLMVQLIVRCFRNISLGDVWIDRENQTTQDAGSQKNMIISMINLLGVEKIPFWISSSKNVHLYCFSWSSPCCSKLSDDGTNYQVWIMRIPFL